MGKMKAVKKLAKKVVASKTGKMTPAMVPVRTLPHSYWLQLKAMHDNPNSAFDKPKKVKKKYRIYRMVLVKEFRATEEVAQAELNKAYAKRKRKGTLYWLDTVEPRRQRPPRCCRGKK